MFSFQKSIKLLIALPLLILGIMLPVTPTLAQEGKQQEQGTLVYTVKPGDTLMAIALRYNLSLADIALANNLSDSNLIFPGQQLTLPDISRGVPAQPQTTSEGGRRTYTIQPGDTLFTIASTYGVSLDSIITAN